MKHLWCRFRYRLHKLHLPGGRVFFWRWLSGNDGPDRFVVSACTKCGYLDWFYDGKSA